MRTMYTLAMTTKNNKTKQQNVYLGAPKSGIALFANVIEHGTSRNCSAHLHHHPLLAPRYLLKSSTFRNKGIHPPPLRQALHGTASIDPPLRREDVVESQQIVHPHAASLRTHVGHLYVVPVEVSSSPSHFTEGSSNPHRFRFPKPNTSTCGRNAKTTDLCEKQTI